MRIKVLVSKINERIWEVTAGVIVGIACTEDSGTTWELSPNLRRYEKSVFKKLGQIT